MISDLYEARLKQSFTFEQVYWAIFKTQKTYGWLVEGGMNLPLITKSCAFAKYRDPTRGPATYLVSIQKPCIGAQKVILYLLTGSLGPCDNHI